MTTLLALLAGMVALAAPADAANPLHLQAPLDSGSHVRPQSGASRAAPSQPWPASWLHAAEDLTSRALHRLGHDPRHRRHHRHDGPCCDSEGHQYHGQHHGQRQHGRWPRGAGDAQGWREHSHGVDPSRGVLYAHVVEATMVERSSQAHSEVAFLLRRSSQASAGHSSMGQQGVNEVTDAQRAQLTQLRAEADAQQALDWRAAKEAGAASHFAAQLRAPPAPPAATGARAAPALLHASPAPPSPALRALWALSSAPSHPHSSSGGAQADMAGGEQVDRHEMWWTSRGARRERWSVAQPPRSCTLMWLPAAAASTSTPASYSVGTHGGPGACVVGERAWTQLYDLGGEVRYVHRCAPLCLPWTRMWCCFGGDEGLRVLLLCSIATGAGALM
jgi:hypothetical protein